jgi:hypothetical protein
MGEWLPIAPSMFTPAECYAGCCYCCLIGLRVEHENGGLDRQMNFQWSIPAVDERASRRLRYRIWILIPLAAFLLWEVVTRSVAAYLADSRPELALHLWSTNSTALLNLAEKKLNFDRPIKVEPVVAAPSSAGEQSSGSNIVPSAQEPDLAGQSHQTASEPVFSASGGADAQADALIRSWAELALLNDPLNARAFRILGQLADRAPDEERTRMLMQGAVRRSLRESVAVYWMMQKSYKKQDYRAAIRYADVLLRTRPQVLIQVMPMLGRIAENQDGNAELKQLLASNPPWRPQFFYYFPLTITDARTPLDFFLSLRNSTTSPTAADVRSYLDFLVRHGFYELAYFTWLQFLPAEQLSKAGRLFNGSFETRPSGLPFDWVLSLGKGVTPKIAARSDGSEHGLFLKFGPGRVDFPGIAQLVVLPPGEYHLQGKYKIDIVGQRGLQWHITCASGLNTPIGESPLFNGTGSEWRDFEVSFTVPNTDCPAQYVRLGSGARSASEQFISGSIWYDDLRIVRNETSNP